MCEILHSFFHAKSSKSDLYFTLRVHLSLDSKCYTIKMENVVLSELKFFNVCLMLRFFSLKLNKI